MSSVTKRCLFCQKEVVLSGENRFDPIEAKLVQEKQAMCQECARERRLDVNAKYFVFAGDMYQRVSHVYLRLWPVGTFH